MILYDRKNKNIRFADVIHILRKIYEGEFYLIKNIFIEEYPELEYMFKKYTFETCNNFDNNSPLPEKLDSYFIGHSAKYIFYERSYIEYKIFFVLLSNRKETVKINSGYCILFDNMSKVFLDVENEEIKIFIKRFHNLYNKYYKFIETNYSDLIYYKKENCNV